MQTITSVRASEKPATSRMAFALREKLTDTEKASVQARYYVDVTGELYKAIEALQILRLVTGQRWQIG